MSDENNRGLPPREWCERMRDSSGNDDDAKTYQTLAEQWSDKSVEDGAGASS